MAPTFYGRTPTGRPYTLAPAGTCRDAEAARRLWPDAVTDPASLCGCPDNPQGHPSGCYADPECLRCRRCGYGALPVGGGAVACGCPAGLDRTPVLAPYWAPLLPQAARVAAGVENAGVTP